MCVSKKKTCDRAYMNDIVIILLAVIVAKNCVRLSRLHKAKVAEYELKLTAQISTNCLRGEGCLC